LVAVASTTACCHTIACHSFHCCVMQVVGAAASQHANLDSNGSFIMLANLHVYGVAPQVHAC
jgi:hypothetical protein